MIEIERPDISHYLAHFTKNKCKRSILPNVICNVDFTFVLGINKIGFVSRMYTPIH